MKQSDNKSGTVFNIQKFSVRDGPGIRTVVFLKGCPLRCKWCGNPESQNVNKELMWTKSKCIQCGSCKKVDVCNALRGLDENNSSLEIEYDRLPEDFSIYERICPTEALQVIGKTMSVTEVISSIEKDSIFYDNSDGGMTLSGGEPLSQSGFAIELLKEAYGNTDAKSYV